MYAPFNVPDLLGRPLEMSLTKDSSITGLIFLIKQHIGVERATDEHRVGRGRVDGAGADG